MDVQANEQQRLAALTRYDILDTPPEEPYDRITRLVRNIFSVKMSAVTMIDAHRQWFKSRQGLDDCEIPRGYTLCNNTIAHQKPLVVPDTLLDGRFVSNPFVAGAPFIRFYAGVPLCSPEGHAVGTLCALDDKPHGFDTTQLAIIADLAGVVMEEMEMRTLVMRDALTGALSRRALRDEFASAITLAGRHRHELSCIMFDLDHFKSINDTHGHGVGDVVLKTAVEACHAELRATDIIGRIGGEEFVIVLPHTGLHAALSVAEKLRAAIAHMHVDGRSGPVSVSASFGIATLDSNDTDVDRMLQQADTALYAAKSAGRNACRVWTQEEPVVNQGVLPRVLKAGQISFSGPITVDCTVRGLSGTGALLNVLSTADLPDRFELGIAAEDFRRPCKVAARSERHIEVTFE
jgi:diguanylate cyclase (GGDEF)-like protein